MTKFKIRSIECDEIKIERAKGMTRATFIKKLKAIGDLPVPTGHARTNKGVTTYFFPHSKIEEVGRLLQENISDEPRYITEYTPVSLHFNACARNVVLYIHNDFVSVAIVHWQ